MGWIAALGSVAAAGVSAYSNNQASKDAAKAARPYHTWMPGVGNAQFQGTNIWLQGDEQFNALQNRLGQSANDSLGMFNQVNAGIPGAMNFLGAQANQANVSNSYQLSALQNAAGSMPNSFFGNGNTFQQQAQQAQGLGNLAMGVAPGQMGQGANFMSQGQNLLNGQGDFTGNMLSNFDPTQAANQYTNNLRAQALPGEQQATASALTGLFNKGRLGTTGGANQMGALQQAQQQADLGRQNAGMQYGMQQSLMQQQGYDAALNAEQGRQLNQMGMGANLAQTGQGMFGQALNNAGLGMGLGQSADAFGFDRMMGLSNTNFDRAGQLYTASNTATQDRFNRAMQMFGLQNATAQQQLGNFQGLLGAQQSQGQQLMDMGRLGASVGQAQGTAGAAAANMRNQGTQDMIAGFMGAIGSYYGAKNGQGGGS